MKIRKIYLFVLLCSCFIFMWVTAQPKSTGTEWKSEINIGFITDEVDSIMKTAINNEAFPGAQLKVWYKGAEIFHKAYGFHTYDSVIPVQKEALYDLASVTKIAGPLLALMKLYEEGKIDLDVPFSTYWKSWRSRKDKKYITLRELLAHQSGLEAYIPFVQMTTRDGKLKRRFFREKRTDRFGIQVYNNLFVKSRFERKMWRHLKRAEVGADKKYLYSGIASLIYPKLIEQLSGKPYESYLNIYFYKPLGCKTLGFNPIPKGLGPVIPTEIDTIFRNDLVKGWVHDENAALLGGISGNAGLFGSAQDLAILMQMLVQGGEYNGKRFLETETINEFTRIQFPDNGNRRGLGFDKPMIGNDTLSLKESYPAPEVSPRSFGHSGFTGTFVWADPDHELVFIFLSNRVYPDRSHRKLYEMNIRPALQQVFYRHINKRH